MKNSSGISLNMYLIMVSGVLRWTLYGFGLGELAVGLANIELHFYLQLFCFIRLKKLERIQIKSEAYKFYSVEIELANFYAFIVTCMKLRELFVPTCLSDALFYNNNREK